MVTQYGMSDALGPITLGQREHEVFLGRDLNVTPDYSDQVAFEIDTEVRRLIDEAHDEALTVLQANREKLDDLAGALMERETLDGEEVARILEGMTMASPKDAERRSSGIAVFRRSNGERSSD